MLILKSVFLIKKRIPY